jgi:hypothetical protein
VSGEAVTTIVYHLYTNEAVFLFEDMLDDTDDTDHRFKKLVTTIITLVTTERVVRTEFDI